MNTDPTLQPATIATAYSFAFEKAASGATESAKIDYADRPYEIREWVGQMETSFRALIADDKTADEDAALVAIALFNPKNTAKVRLGGLKGWWHRLFFYERYSTHRLIAPVAFGMFHAWYRTSGSLQITTISAQYLRIKMVLFGWNYFSGLFIIAIIVVTRAITRVFPSFKVFGHGMALVVVAKVFVGLAVEWYGSVCNWLEKAEIAWYEPSRYVNEGPVW